MMLHWCSLTAIPAQLGIALHLAGAQKRDRRQVILEMGFAKSGTAKAMVASKAILRRNEFDFMRVNSFRSESSQL